MGVGPSTNFLISRLYHRICPSTASQYGSMGASTSQSSPTRCEARFPSPPAASPSTFHNRGITPKISPAVITSADIRHSPLASELNPLLARGRHRPHWPLSPKGPVDHDRGSRIRDSFSSYSIHYILLPRPTDNSRPTTPLFRMEPCRHLNRCSWGSGEKCTTGLFKRIPTTYHER